MTHALFLWAGGFARMRAGAPDPAEKQIRAIGVARARARLRGKRPNPALHDVATARNVAGRLVAAWYNHRAEKRWQRELQALDDRQLRDIGITRGDADRLRFWI